jgi:hypothetical protein
VAVTRKFDEVSHQVPRPDGSGWHRAPRSRVLAPTIAKTTRLRKVGGRLVWVVVSAPVVLVLWLWLLTPGSVPVSARAATHGPESRRVVRAVDIRFVFSIVAPSSTTSTNSTLPTTTTTSTWADPVTPAERAAWEKVNACEEHGNWHVQGARFSGGLGISENNWVAYGGQRDFGAEWAASEDAQIVVAMRMQPNPPDQSGCSAW